ncbi:MAG: hypothetical protein WBG90_20360 [Saonia sp.]
MISGAAPRLLLLGTSHVGKSSCAKALADLFGVTVTSTDTLGRHPGRPWTGVPGPVLDFYQSLSPSAVHWFLQIHHENMRPVIGHVIDSAPVGTGFILEGAALRPEYLEGWGIAPKSAVCLHADANTLKARMLESSEYATHAPDIRTAIDAFIQRSLTENDVLAETSARHGLRVLDTTDAEPRSIARLIAEQINGA